jgi:hypothetical protein
MPAITRSWPAANICNEKKGGGSATERQCLSGLIGERDCPHADEFPASGRLPSQTHTDDTTVVALVFPHLPGPVAARSEVLGADRHSSDRPSPLVAPAAQPDPPRAVADHRAIARFETCTERSKCQSEIAACAVEEFNPVTETFFTYR